MELAEKIIRRLDELDMRQAKLARLIGETPQRLNKWLQGVGVPKPDDLVAIARALDLPLEYLADSSIDDPAGLIHLDEDGRAVLTLYRALGLERDEALRRLARPADPRPAAPPVKPPGPLPPPGLSVPGRPDLFEPVREPGRPVKRSRRGKA